MRLGYGRVSTKDQVLDAQKDALKKAKCDKIYVDVASGRLSKRIELEKVLSHLRSGDELVITRLDRLGRSLEHLISLSKDFEERKVNLIVLDQNIDTSTALGKMFFHILGAIAEFERGLLSERTKDGLSAARARGKVGGRPKKLSNAQIKALRSMCSEVDGDGIPVHTLAEVADSFGIGRTSVYRYVEE